MNKGKFKALFNKIMKYFDKQNSEINLLTLQ